MALVEKILSLNYDFRNRNPELKFSHFVFPENWKGDFESVDLYFDDSKEVFSISEFAKGSKTRSLLEELLRNIYDELQNHS